MPSIEGNQFDERDFRRGAWHQTATMVALLTPRAGERQNVMACEWASAASHFRLGIQLERFGEGYFKDSILVVQ